MARPDPGVPQWAIGPVSELVAVADERSRTPADTDRFIGQFDAALTVWRSDPVRYAEHFGFLSDILCGHYFASGDADKLDRAVELWHEATAIGAVSGLVSYRLRLLGIYIDLAVARRDRGSDAMAQQLSGHCSSLREEIKHLSAATLLGDITNNCRRWADAAAKDDHWAAAADAYELATRAADQLFRTVGVEERLTVSAAFRSVPAEAASALMRAERLQDAVVVLEAARQRSTRFLRGNVDLDRLLKVRDPELYEQYCSVQAAWAAATRDWLHHTNPAEMQAARERARVLEDRVKATVAQVNQLPALEHFLNYPRFGEIVQAADPFPLLYVWTSRYDTSLVLVLPDGSITARYLDGLTNDHIAAILVDRASVAHSDA